MKNLTRYFRLFLNHLKHLIVKLKSLIKLNQKRIPYLIFIILCLFGCLYHVIKITEIYFEFETKIDVSFDSTSQIVVPFVSFCKPRYALMINESLRDYSKINVSKMTPAEIDNNTYGSSEIILICYFFKLLPTGYFYIPFKCTDQKERVQIDKTVNYFYICYNIKHPQFNSTKRYRHQIYDFWLYHHHPSEFRLFLTSDNNIPYDLSENSLDLIGNKLYFHFILMLFN